MAVSSKKLLRAITHPRDALASLCQRYLDSYRAFSYDFHRNGESELLSRLAKVNPKVVFDVGANVGNWSRIAHDMFPAATVHCFEISEGTVETLKSNLSTGRFVVNNVGLSDRAGRVKYKDYGTNAGVNTILLDAQYHDADIRPRLAEAELVTGAQYCRAHGIEAIDVLKIDVEGAEHLVLAGFADILERAGIRVVQFEYGYTNGDSKFLMRDFHRFFAAYGYTVARVSKGPMRFRAWTYRDNDFTSGPNYVAVHQDDCEVMELLSH